GGLVRRSAARSGPPVAHVHVGGLLGAGDLEHVRRLGAVGGAVAEVLPSAPGAVGEVRRGGVLRLVGVPSGGAGGDQEVDAVPFEHGRGFAVVAVEGVQQFLDVEV